MSVLSCVYSYTEPPPYDGYIDQSSNHWCINRHGGGVNVLFATGSVRKVGLKEIWTLKWNDTHETNGPWTRAGGVQPGDWPHWMRRFKEY